MEQATTGRTRLGGAMARSALVLVIANKLYTACQYLFLRKLCLAWLGSNPPPETDLGPLCVFPLRLRKKVCQRPPLCIHLISGNPPPPQRSGGDMCAQPPTTHIFSQTEYVDRNLPTGQNAVGLVVCRIIPPCVFLHMRLPTTEYA